MAGCAARDVSHISAAQWGVLLAGRKQQVVARVPPGDLMEIVCRSPCDSDKRLRHQCSGFPTLFPTLHGDFRPLLNCLHSQMTLWEPITLHARKHRFSSTRCIHLHINIERVNGKPRVLTYSPTPQDLPAARFPFFEYLVRKEPSASSCLPGMEDVRLSQEEVER